METPFGATGCFCDTREAHDTHYVDGRNVETYGTRYSSPPWADIIKCAHTLDGKMPLEIARLENTTHIEALIASFYLLDVVIFDLADEWPVERRSRQFYAPEVYADVWETLEESGIVLCRKITTQRLSAEAQLLKHKYATHLAKSLRTYLHWAIACELRHHGAWAKTFDNTSRIRAYYGWQRLVKEVGVIQAIEWAEELFNERSEVHGGSVWRGSYGGSSWAAIANILAMYERGYIDNPEQRRRTDVAWWHPAYRRGEFSDYEFVDRVVTLQHNTGTCLDKINWVGGLRNLRFILNSHHVTNLRGLYLFSTTEAQTLFKDYWDAKNTECGTDIPLPVSFGQCVACANSEYTLNIKKVPLCTYHYSTLCIDGDCLNRVHGNDRLCYPCMKRIYDGTHIDSAFPERLILKGSMIFVTHNAIHGDFWVCLEPDCECSYPLVKVRNSKVYFVAEKKEEF